jgi:hypothetical protein
MNKIIIEAYKCEKCEQLYYTEASAMNCCKSSNCKTCGKEIPKHRDMCEECSDKQRFESAKKYTYEEYVKEFPDNYFFYNDNYYPSIEELLEYIYDNSTEDKVEFPEYVYGTNEYIIDIDIESVISDAEYNSNLEDFEFDNTKELIDFVNEWNERNSSKAYQSSYKTIVYIPKELLEEFQEEI